MISTINNYLINDVNNESSLRKKQKMPKIYLFLNLYSSHFRYFCRHVWSIINRDSYEKRLWPLSDFNLYIEFLTFLCAQFLYGWEVKSRVLVQQRRFHCKTMSWLYAPFPNDFFAGNLRTILAHFIWLRLEREVTRLYMAIKTSS